MPQMADIIVKKADGTTNITYSQQSPSSGDKTPAVWKSRTAGTAIAFQPELRVSAQGGSGPIAPAQSGPVRRIKATYYYPQLVTNTTNSVTSVHRQEMASADFTVPADMAATDVAEAAQQFANLLASALVQACVKEGYAAS